MTGHLLVMVPTRGRPANVERLIAACHATGATADFCLMFDMDDPSPPEALDLLPSGWHHHVMVPDCCLRIKLNAATELHSGYQVYAFLGDDAVPETPGWDRALAEAARGGWSYPAGSRQDVPEHVAIDAAIIRALGWFACPAMNHYWLDNAWADLARGCNRLRYLPDVIVRHDRGEPDATTARGLEHAHHDAEAYKTWRAGQYASDLQTCRSLLDPVTYGTG